MEHSGGQKIIYLDAGAGVSGDMFMGAMVDIAKKLDPDFDLSALLKKIAVDEYETSVTPDKRAGISGLKFDVHTHEHHPHRHLSDIRDILNGSGIPAKARDAAISAFTLLAEAEARVHSSTPEEIHFHEVGAIDAIVDITGAMLMMDHLGWPLVLSSPVNVGSGTVKCAHGVLPVPAPATARLLEGLKIYSAGEPMERTTPTGALLLKVLVGPDGFRDLPVGRILCSGVGLGGKETPELPNVLRAILFEDESDRSGAGRFERDEPSLIEANIDDMNPQDFTIVIEDLLAGGALDAWCENILMKKGRPAVKLCCLSAGSDVEKFAELIMRNTTTLGVRITETRRLMLGRRIDVIKTPLGDVRVKSALLDGAVLRRAPEYDDIAAVARKKNLPPSEIRRIVSREID